MREELLNRLSQAILDVVLKSEWMRQHDQQIRVKARAEAFDEVGKLLDGLREQK